MFEVNGLIISEDAYTIIEELQTQLHLNGILLLHTIKPEHNNNIQFSCPSHKQGLEHKPSCGMLTANMYSNGKMYEAGTVHCFTCGYTASLSEFISLCWGKHDGGIYGNAWLKKNFTTIFAVNRELIDIKSKASRNHQPVKKDKVVIPESVLDSLRYYHPYMYKRKLTDEIIELFDVGFDKQSQCITFPVKDLDGDVVFIQPRSVKSKFFHYAEGVEKTDYVYGAYEVLEHYGKNVTVTITESIINALTLWTLDQPAVALMGTGGGKQYEILKTLPFRNYRMGLDPDEAGYRGTNRLIKHLKQTKLLSKYEYYDSRDINDLGSEILNVPIIMI